MTDDAEAVAEAWAAEAGKDHENVRGRFDQLLANLTDEQVLRIHVFDGMGCADIDGRILIENMNMVYEWIMHQSLPHKVRPRVVSS